MYPLSRVETASREKQYGFIGVDLRTVQSSMRFAMIPPKQVSTIFANQRSCDGLLSSVSRKVRSTLEWITMRYASGRVGTGIF